MCLNPKITPELKTVLDQRLSEINPNLEKKRSRKTCLSETAYKRWWNRYVQVFTELDTEDIHYEYYQGHACLHLEGRYASNAFSRQARELKRASKAFEGEIKWLAPEQNCISCIVADPVNGTEDLIRKLHRLHEIFEEQLKRIYHAKSSFRPLTGTYTPPQSPASRLDTGTDTVSLRNCKIEELMNLPLAIPDYQRIYCWDQKEIVALWEDLNGIIADRPYHLGTIILQHRENRYEVVDGQQRLVTLTLLLWGLGYTGSLPLLAQRFQDTDAIRHVANAKAVIRSLIQPLPDNELQDRIIGCVTFSVLVVEGENLDLACTFFSNQNSKGVKLTDFDLLKAHHLRYISAERQAIHVASKWTELTAGRENDGPQIEKSLGQHIYRMRKLIRKQNFNEFGHYIRDEFRAAPLMDDIPPFGERLDYYEPIQGGAHFFAFAEHFNNRYAQYIETKQVETLRRHFGGRHKVYSEIAESLLFAYYLKFGTPYLSEALFCILLTLSEHRYQKARALPDMVQRYALDSNLIQMLEFSSSPTFFFAESLRAVGTGAGYYDLTGVRWNFYKQLCELFAELKDFSDSTIIKRIEDEF